MNPVFVRRSAWLVALIILLIAAQTAFAAGPILPRGLSGETPVLADGGDAPAGDPQMQRLDSVLNADGTLNIEAVEGAQSFDPSGYVMETAADGAPRFVQATGAAPSVAAMPAAAGDEKWDDRFGTPGVGSYVNAIVVNGNDVYVGGYFTAASNIQANHVARWDGRRWYPLGDGVDGTVNGMAMSNGMLYVVGDFDKAGTVRAKGVAKWNGTAWSALGNGEGPTDEYGYSATAYAIAVSGNTVYVGGDFAKIDGVDAYNIAKWTGTGWQPLGRGVGGSYDEGQTLSGGDVRVIVVDGTDVYVGGYGVEYAGTVQVNGIARWDGANWHALGGGVTEVSYSTSVGSVYAIAVHGEKVYVGGDFTHAGGQPARNVAMWDGDSWAALGTGVTNDYDSAKVTAIAVVNGIVYVGGDFNIAGSDEIKYMAQWSNGAWSSVGGGTSAAVNAVTPDGMGGIYVGGYWMDNAGEMYVRNVGHWTGTTWDALGEGVMYSSIPGTVYAVAVAATGEVYIGGYFTTVGGMTVNNIAMWDGVRWWPLGSGVNSTVYSIATRGENVYVGGDFTNAGGRSANHVARWDSAVQQWINLASGTNGDVKTIVVVGDLLLVGGDFSAAGSTDAEDVAIWDERSKTWSKFGANGIDFAYSAEVRALAVTGGLVFIGGSFSGIHLPPGATRATPVNSLVIWDSADDSLSYAGNQDANGVTIKGSYTDYAGYVNALALVGKELFVAGRFDKAATISANGIAKYVIGTGWQPVGGNDSLGGDETNNTVEVNSLAVYGDRVYIGGEFKTAGPLEVNRIAAWDAGDGAWQTLGSGILSDSSWDDGPLSLAIGGSDLYVGGDFFLAGVNPSSGFARWSITTAVVEGTIPAAGGTFQADNGALQITFPDAAVDQPLDVTYEPMPAQPVGLDRYAVKRFELEARAPDGSLVTEFGANYTLVVNYDQNLLTQRGLSESSLIFAYWDGSAWVPMQATVDAANNRVTVTADHFTEFAIIGSEAPEATPTPTNVPATATTVPTNTPEPTNTPQPGETVVPTNTPQPTNTPRPGATSTPRPGTDTERVFLPMLSRD